MFVRRLIKDKGRDVPGIDQTDEEIRRGIREAKELSAYDTLSDSAYLRAKEDYLMASSISSFQGFDACYGNSMYVSSSAYCVVSRPDGAMTCVLWNDRIQERGDQAAYGETRSTASPSQLMSTPAPSGRMEGRRGLFILIAGARSCTGIIIFL